MSNHNIMYDGDYRYIGHVDYVDGRLAWINADSFRFVEILNLIYGRRRFLVPPSGDDLFRYIIHNDCCNEFFSKLSCLDPI